MAEPRAFGAVDYIGAEAVGQPGQRRFRIRALNTERQFAFLWLEKEQLIALGDAIETVLKDQGFEARPRRLDDADQPPVFPLKANFDFRIGQLSMGVDRDQQLIVLIATEAGEEDTQGLSVGFDYPRGNALAQEITTVVASGRPPCPLCTAPLDAEHVCPKKNGHHPQG